MSNLFKNRQAFDLALNPTSYTSRERSNSREENPWRMCETYDLENGANSLVQIPIVA
jgi:hypothetical protein